MQVLLTIRAVRSTWVLVMQFSPPSCHSIPLGYQNSAQDSDQTKHRVICNRFYLGLKIVSHLGSRSELSAHFGSRAYFGYNRVDTAENSKRFTNFFSCISTPHALQPSYYRDLTSFTWHKLYKNFLMNMCPVFPSTKNISTFFRQIYSFNYAVLIW
jgi:hypothetical protein